MSSFKHFKSKKFAQKQQYVQGVSSFSEWSGDWCSKSWLGYLWCHPPFWKYECFSCRRKFSKKLNIKHLDCDKNEIRRTKRNDFTYFIGKNLNWEAKKLRNFAAFLTIFTAFFTVFAAFFRKKCRIFFHFLPHYIRYPV